jgi:hypothetical protein
MPRSRALAKYASFCALLGVLVAPGRAAGLPLSDMLDRALVTSAYFDQPDWVTAYGTEMVRYRLELTARRGGADFDRPLGPMYLRPEFRAWTWRAADGSLLQGFAGKGGFRLTLGNCLAVICNAQECAEDEWPVFNCSDGRKRKMVVEDFTTAVFDGVRYRRLSAPAAAPGQGG